MLIKDNVTIGIEWRFGPDWPGQRCGAKTRRGTACQRKVSFGKVIVQAARSFAGTRRVLLKATPRQRCLPEGALLLHSRTTNVRARDSDQRQSQHLQRALSSESDYRGTLDARFHLAMCLCSRFVEW